VAGRSIATSILGFVVVSLLTATAQALDFDDDFTGGLNLPWVFLDELGDSPPSFTDVIYNDADQDLKFIGSASDYQQDAFDFNLNAIGYVGIQNPDYFFPNEVHVTATFSLLENVMLGFEDDVEPSNNDVFVIARGQGLNGYVFALDAERREADLVRIDDGQDFALGEDAVLRDLDIDQDGIYTLRLSAVDNTLNGQLYDESMTLIGEVMVEEDTYEEGWTGLGASINDEGEDAFKTLIAASFDNFSASDSLDPGILGDYDNSGALDAPDLDLQAQVIASGVYDAEYDLNADLAVDFTDREIWVRDLKGTWIGDANLNGVFNSGDMVQVFVRGKYEKPETVADWEEGDWNGDTFFNSSDMVAAFVDGGYEKGPRIVAAVSAVPEPSGSVLLLTALIALAARRRRAAWA
jgi:hypothetical protein